MLISVQYLRGLAAWMVVFHHYMQILFDFESTLFIAKMFSWYGGMGVEIFFVVSGIVMHRTATGRGYTASEFYRNRLIRIVPAYWMATLVLIGFILVFPKLGPLDIESWDFRTLLLSFLFVPHEHLGGFGNFPILTVGWTLNFEMFFYTVLAVCILFFRNYAIYICLALMVLLPVAVNLAGVNVAVVSSYLLLLFSAGILVSMCVIPVLLSLTSVPLRVVVFLLLSFVSAFIVFTGLPFYRYIAPCLFVVAFVSLEPFLQQGVRRYLGWLERLGDASYSTYLYHIPVLISVLNLFGVPETLGENALAILFTVLGTLVFSLLSYHLVEVRLQRYLARWFKRGVA